MNMAVQRKIKRIEDWTVWEYDSVNSTNLVAANLPAWSAVRADTQTAGRGRFQREWVSDEGGLWFSAVVPAEPAILPLVAGLAVCDALRELGVKNLRLRWPNDVMVGQRKLAGVLIDRFKPGVAVIGIGVNVNNNPAGRDASLQNQTERLADILAVPVSVENLMVLLLRHIRLLMHALNANEVSSLLSRVNGLWSKKSRVSLDLDGDIVLGSFEGVDAAGRLLLVDALGASVAYNFEQVRHLTEVPEL